MIFECILIPFLLNLCQYKHMTLEKTLIITLDDFIFDMYKIKMSLWKDIEKENNIEVSDHFIMSYYDAHFEKREKIGREYPRIAKFYDEVEKRFNIIIDSSELSVNKIHLEYLIEWSKVYKLIYCTNLKLDQIQKLLTNINFPLEVMTIFSTKQVLNAKPEGDIYLKIARLLKLKTNSLVVIDSTLNGIQASYLANTKGLFLAQFHEVNPTIKKFAFAHFKKSEELNHYVLNLINRSE
jgi:beta-phosphoglucomutase-like phosphatase (HAD superfamily)